jgi:hypothetical protein
MPHFLQIISPESGSVITRSSSLHTGHKVGEADEDDDDDDDTDCGCCIIEDYFSAVLVKLHNIIHAKV